MVLVKSCKYKYTRLSSPV